MKPTIVRCVILLHLLGSIALAGAGEDFLASLLPKIAQDYKSIECIHAQVRVGTDLSDEYMQSEHLDPQSKSMVRDFIYDYSSDHWRIDTTAKDLKDNILYSLVSSYDGERVYLFDRGERRMNISSDKYKLDGWLYFSGVLFFPYSFLKTDPDPRNGFPTNLDILAKGLPPSALALKSIDFKQSGDIITTVLQKSDCTDYVTFSTAQGFFPTSFRRVAKDNFGEVECQFDVQESSSMNAPSTGNSIRFLKKGTLRIYRDKTLQRTDTIEVGSITFGGCDDERFTLDPAMADFIYDSDNIKVIKVPK